MRSICSPEGTGVRFQRFNFMNQPLPHLMEYAVQIAWDYLEKTGQIDDAAFTSRFLMRIVEDMMGKGVRHRLLLSNGAITVYEAYRRDRKKNVAA